MVRKNVVVFVVVVVLLLLLVLLDIICVGSTSYNTQGGIVEVWLRLNSWELSRTEHSDRFVAGVNWNNESSSLCSSLLL